MKYLKIFEADENNFVIQVVTSVIRETVPDDITMVWVIKENNNDEFIFDMDIHYTTSFLDRRVFKKIADDVKNALEEQEIFIEVKYEEDVDIGNMCTYTYTCWLVEGINRGNKVGLLSFKEFESFWQADREKYTNKQLIEMIDKKDIENLLFEILEKELFCDIRDFDFLIKKTKIPFYSDTLEPSYTDAYALDVIGALNDWMFGTGTGIQKIEDDENDDETDSSSLVSAAVYGSLNLHNFVYWQMQEASPTKRLEPSG